MDPIWEPGSEAGGGLAGETAREEALQRSPATTLGEVRRRDPRPEQARVQSVARNLRHCHRSRQGLRPRCLQAPRLQGHPQLPAGSMRGRGDPRRRKRQEAAARGGGGGGSEGGGEEGENNGTGGELFQGDAVNTVYVDRVLGQ